MIGVKGGTQTWSTAQQQSSLKGDGVQSMSAKEKDSVLGDQELGDYLNKVADPNWVDPTKTRRVGNSELDKDAFLKLFLAQLKNQDPTNPMQSHELAAQLAQFTSLEKLNNIDTGISAMNKKDDPSKSYDALNLIGKAVGGDSSKIFRGDIKSKHDVTFNLGAAATEVELSVRNSAGQEVKKLIAHNLKPGPNKVNWDGMIDSGAAAQEGEYNVVISAKNSVGQKIAAETKFEGRVSGVNFTAEGPVLMVGKQSIKMSDVKKIFDPSELKAEATLAQTIAVAGKDAKNLVSNSSGMGGSLENVGMSQDLINKLQKDATGGSANGANATDSSGKQAAAAGQENKHGN
ncbi:MAG: flagellar hook capping FlgD N-terminal domain-containing protein [Bdellovibrionales bacterium]